MIAPAAFLVFVVLLSAGILLYALSRKREVKAGLKIPFATFFFEASDNGVDVRPEKNKNKREL
jgi:hypothetical protein